MTMTADTIRRGAATLGVGGVLALAALAPANVHAAPRAPRVIHVVGAENFYADVMRQIGGAHVSALGIINNPNTDPHTYESSTTDANAVARADLVVRNGLGYDDFIAKLENASPSKTRVTIDVGAVFGRKAGDNPHQWYDPATMPKVAALVAAQFGRLDPADRATFQANVKRFDASLAPWRTQIAALKKRYKGVPVAVTEPVFGYALAAIGASVLTPRSFQLAIQEGNDPSPQDVRIEETLLRTGKVKLFAYNQQAVAPVTLRLLPLARARHIPIVGVYESMPLSRTYQTWMEAETTAVAKALGRGVSTEVIT